MKRNFKVGNERYLIVSRFTKDYEINENNLKYDLMRFDTELNAWTRVASCNTLREGRIIAEENFIRICNNN